MIKFSISQTLIPSAGDDMPLISCYKRRNGCRLLNEAQQRDVPLFRGSVTIQLLTPPPFSYPPHGGTALNKHARRSAAAAKPFTTSATEKFFFAHL